MTVAAVVGVSGLAVLTSRAIQMVVAGRGLETYRTFWLVEFNYIGLLVLLGALVVALLTAFLVAAVQRARERALWRELDQKYGDPK